jgi:hypothetical protein
LVEGTGFDSCDLLCRFRSKSEQVIPEQAAQNSTGTDTLGREQRIGGSTGHAWSYKCSSEPSTSLVGCTGFRRFRRVSRSFVPKSVPKSKRVVRVLLTGLQVRIGGVREVSTSATYSVDVACSFRRLPLNAHVFPMWQRRDNIPPNTVEDRP